MATSYPFDPNGQAPSNKIVNENHTLPAAAFRNFHFIIPDNAPFHRNGLVIRHHPNGGQGNGIELIEGQDYWLTHKFTAATRSIGRPIYGSISFINKNLSGIISVDYQTIGGDWTLDSNKIIEILSNQMYNPRITTWDEVADPPYAFPATNHHHDLEDLKGMEDVIEALDALTEAVQQSRDDAWNAHIEDKTSNPHKVTKAQVGLSEVQNYPISSPGQAMEGEDNESYMTPLRTSQLLNAFLDGYEPGTGGGGTGSGNVIGPELSTTGSIPTFDGVSGKILADLNLLRATVNSAFNRLEIGRANSDRDTILSLIDGGPAGRRINITVPKGSLTQDLSLLLPRQSGRLIVDQDMAIDPSHIPFRTYTAEGRGNPDGQLLITHDTVPFSVPTRTVDGTLLVEPAMESKEALPRGQAEEMFVPKSAHGLVPMSSIVGDVGQPTNGTLLNTAGLVNLLQQYVKWDDIGDIGGGGASALDIVFLDEENLPYTTQSNRIVVLPELVATEAIMLPGSPANGDRVVVCTTTIVPGVSLAITGSGKSIGGQLEDLVIDTPHANIDLQFDETTDSWVVISRSQYAPTGLPNNYAPVIYRGTFSLAGNELPNVNHYAIGAEFEITDGRVINGVNYPNGSTIRRTPTGWSLTSANDTSDLEATLDTLIEGFNNLAAALA